MIDYKNDGFKNRGLDLDITNKCTLQCSQCARSIWDYKTKDIPGGDLTIDEWKDLTDYFSSLTLNGTFGDPIFNPNLIEMLRIACSKNVHVSISNTKKKKPMEFYIDAFRAHPKAEWRFGIDGLPYQSFVYRENQDGEKLFEVMKTASEMGIDCKWQYIVFSYNEDKISQAIQMAKDIGVTLELNYSGRTNDFLEPKNKKFKEKLEKDKEEFRPKCLSMLNDTYMTQERLPYVTTTKQVLPCCWLDADVLHSDQVDERYEPLLDASNNLNNNKVKDIVNSKAWNDFFDKITNGDVPDFCKSKCSSKMKNTNRHKEVYINGKLSR